MHILRAASVAAALVVALLSAPASGAPTTAGGTGGRATPLVSPPSWCATTQGPKNAQPARVVYIGNGGSVYSGATPSTFTTTKAFHVTQVVTYHWNGGKGAPPGEIGITEPSTGKTCSWRTYGQPGQGGVANAYWVADTSFDLPAGRYQFYDSNPATWAQNSATNGTGMAWIFATPAASAPTGTTTSPATGGSWATVAQPSTATSGSRPVKVGSLTGDQVQLTVPGGSFGAPTQLTLGAPTAVPQVNTSQLAPAGTIVEIKAGNPRRLNKAATVTFRLDKATYANNLRAGSIWVAYYVGNSWFYFMPNSVNPAAGTVSFDTYHFSLFGLGKISVEERVDSYVHSKTLSDLTQKQADKIVDKLVEQSVGYILKKRLGLTDETADDSVKFKILSSLANDDEYRDLVDKFREGDVTGFNETFQTFVGKKIAEELPKSMWKSALKFVADSGTGLIKASSQAAGYAAEGQYLEAGRILGTKIAEKFMFTKIVKIGTELVQYSIDTWKDAETEAAYKAFRDGSSNKFFGYNVDAGDFNAVWNQMAGLATRLQSEAVAGEVKRREELGLPPPTERDLNKVRDQVETELGEQFRTRRANETAMAKQQKRLKALIDAFQKNRLLEDGLYGYHAYEDAGFHGFESRLDQLIKLTSKILRDTGRKDWNMTAFTNDRELSINDLVVLIKAWYSPNIKPTYDELIKTKFKKPGTTTTPQQPGTTTKGRGIAGNFTLSYGSTWNRLPEALYRAAVINVVNGKVSAKATLPPRADSDSQYSGITLTLSGTYDRATGNLTAALTYGWQQGSPSGSPSVRTTYTYTLNAKPLLLGQKQTRNVIKQGDTTAMLSFTGTATTAISSLRYGAWSKPETSTQTMTIDFSWDVKTRP